MSQQPHFTATATPADITAGLPPGCYLAQPRADYGAVSAILYATAEATPADPNDYFQAGAGESFVFAVGAGVPPTWVAIDPGIARLYGVTGVPVAIARADS